MPVATKVSCTGRLANPIDQPDAVRKALDGGATRNCRLTAGLALRFAEATSVYGADKVWRQLNREGVAVARCTVERLMHQEGLQVVRRGKAVCATVSDPKAPCPLDRVNRQFRAERPNQLWVSDFTYVSTWQG